MGRWFSTPTRNGRSRNHSTRTQRRIRRRTNQQESLESRILLAADPVAQWLADSLNQEYADGAVVATWNDTVAGIAATGRGSPVLVQNALSGRSVLRFDNSDDADSFRVPGADHPMSGATEFTVAVVFATNSNDLVGGTTNWFENTGLVDANRIGLTADWGIALNQSGQVGAGMGEGFLRPTYSAYSTESGLNDGDIHLATLTFSDNTMSLYVDAGAPTQIATPDLPPRNTIDMTFGILQSSGPNPYTGDLAEVRIYDAALDAAGVAELYQEIRSYYDNSAPVAVNDGYTLNEDPPLGIYSVSAANGVLKNDTDAEGDPLRAVLVAGPAHGTLSLMEDGSFLYAPERNFFGTDTFTYITRDGQDSNVATVTLNVTNVYDRAVAQPDSYKAVPSQVLTVPVNEGVLANDQNPDQVTLNAVLETNVPQGTLTLNADGSFQYNPQGFAGRTSFTYRIQDGTNLSTPATVTILVNTPPQAVNDTYTLDEDVTLSRSAANGVTANDVDPEGSDPRIVSLVSAPQHGLLNLAQDGSFTYAPDQDYFGADQFTYRLSDGKDTSNVATVNLTIRAVNDAPMAASDTYYGLAGDSIVVSADRGVLANDTDVDSPSMTAVLTTGPTQGQLTLQPDGAFTYTPNAGFKGTDAFRYVAQDGQTQSPPIEVKLYVGSSPVRISEVVAANVATLSTRVREQATDSFRGLALTPDWIELQNLSSSPLDVSGLHMTEQRDDPMRWAFPEGTIIPANGYLVVFADRLNITDPALDELGLLHTNFKLGVEGEYVAITSAEGEVLHSLDPGYPKLRADVAYGYTPDGTLGYLLAATPGDDNTGVYPGVVADTSFSVDRGFYTEPFAVEISTATGGATIRYTLDGSNPNSTSGQIYTGPIPITTTTVLKAIAFLDDYLPSNVDVQTYIFPSDVLLQDGEGLGGVRWGHAGPDWEMDPNIVNHEDPEVRPEPEDLLRIPTVSLSVNFDQMFGSGGIYIAGEDVEIPAGFEYFDPARPDNGIHTNSTIQIVGGTSPQRWKVDKLSMRVRFTEDEGASELEYPVFGTDAVSQFDTLVIDARLNNVWHYGGGSDPTGQRNRADYMRDEFASDLQNALGGYATHAQHVHVYINGIYWGMHILHERPDDNFAASYRGGFAEDYDVIKHRSSTVVSGTGASYQQLLQLARQNLADPANYEAIKQELDIDAFIDYMLLNFYIGNTDWAHQNWYASYDRTDPEGKWLFHSWDAEHTMESISVDVTTKNDSGGPSEIHQRLTANPEYRLLFADHIQRHMKNDGILTPDVASQIYKDRADEINLVMRVESARWGDNQFDRSRIRYTRLHWLNNPYAYGDLMENYFPRRTDIVLSQLVRRNLYEANVAPEFRIGGTPQHGGFVDAGSSLTMQAPEGTIFYTTDGSDPRVEGGQIAPSASSYTGAIPVNATLTVRARLRKTDGSWSPVSEARFVTSVPADSSSLRISEIHYHPSSASPAEVAAGFDDADEFEFIELVNISENSIDLSNVAFVQTPAGSDFEGIGFAFADGSVRELAPQQRVVLVENLEAFQFRYGTNLPVAGQWIGGLSNRSERLVLQAGTETIHDLTYSDEWVRATDGDGPSLQIVDAAGELALWNTAQGWRASARNGGSPGTSDQPVPGDSNHDGVFGTADLVLVLQAGEYEDGIPGNSTFEEGDWNGNGDFDTADFVYVLQLGHYESPAPPQGLAAVPAIDSQVAAALLADSLFASTSTTNPSVESVDSLATTNPQPIATPVLEASDALFEQSLDDRSLNQTASEDWSLDGDLLDLLAMDW